MTNRLFIAEKPSLARAIAAVLTGTFRQHDGYIEVGNDLVTWNFGHLMELAEPAEYNSQWKTWDAKQLPYRFAEWKVRPKRQASARKQLAIIGKLLKCAEVVVHAGDPGREGQLLVDEVLIYHNWQGRTLRLLLNATDPESTRKALSGLSDNGNFRSLFEAAFCRAKADWYVGMNLTVGATKLLSGDELVSIGRVQTPTLALVVNRDLEIEDFRPRRFWNLEAEISTSFGPVLLKFEPREDAKRIWREEEAEAAVSAIRGKRTVLTVKSKTGFEQPPPLFSLPRFQKEANKRLKWSAKKSLDVLQELYDSPLQLTSYPRTDSEKLPPEQKSSAMKLASMLLMTGKFPEATTLAKNFKPRDSVYSQTSDEEHHAIIPTLKTPDFARLTGDQARAYQLIATRFLMNLLPDYRFVDTAMEVDLGGRTFSSRGEVPLNAGEAWRVFDRKAAKSLPNIPTGTPGLVSRARSVEGKTTPPDHYTEGTLIGDMCSVAKFVSDPKQKVILKENSGIGTPATQAAIIETIKNRGFVLATNGQLISTPFGRSVVAALPEKLKDPGITAGWEDALKQMARGQYDPQEFMTRIHRFVDEQLAEFRRLSGRVQINRDRGSAALYQQKAGSKRTSQREARSEASSSKAMRPIQRRTKDSRPKGGR